MTLLRSLRLGGLLAIGTLIPTVPALAEVPRVVTDIAPVQALVATVLGELGTVDVLVGPGTSPHHHSLRPSEARALQDADIVVWIGASLMPGLEKPLQTLAEGTRILSLSDVPDTRRLDNRTAAVFQEHSADDDHANGHDDHENHSHDHSHDQAETSDGAHAHDHGAYDPHLWLDPQNAALWLDAVADMMSAVDPDHAEIYQRNAADGRARIATAVVAAKAVLAPVKQTQFVVGHDAFQYFEAAFDLDQLGAIQLSDDSAPSPARVATLRDAMESLDVTCVLVEPGYKPGLIAALQTETTLKIAQIDPMGFGLPGGADLYPALIADTADKMADCLGAGTPG